MDSGYCMRQRSFCQKYYFYFSKGKLREINEACSKFIQFYFFFLKKAFEQNVIGMLI